MPSSDTARESRSFWSAARSAIRGDHDHDYTSGDIGRSVILLAIPMVLEMAMESVFAVVDVFFVSRLGPAAIATVGLTESLMTLVYTLAMGLGIGATAVVSRRIGERDSEGASVAAAQALWVGAGLAIAIGVAGAIFAPQLLRLMGAEDDVIATGTAFARVMLGGNASVLMLFLVNAVFRGAGDAAIAMRTLWLANLINIVLGPCLIFGIGPFPQLGVTGAAVGTTIGRAIGALYAIQRLVRPGARLRVERRHWIVVPGVMLRLIRLSASGTFQIFIGTFSWVMLTRIASTFGSEVIAGYTIAIRVVVFALLPSWGMSNAAATMVGQALGAGNPDRAERAVWIACRYNAGFLTAIGILFLLLAPVIASVFTTDPVAVANASRALRIISSGFVFYGVGMVVTQAFNGAGDTWTPTWINFFCFLLWQIPLGWALARGTALGPNGVYLAVAVGEATLALVSVIIFRRGAWKLKTV